MAGFFTQKEVESQDRPGGKKYSCISCGGYKNCITPKMEPYGNFKKRIIIMGSFTEDIDDENGMPFQSRFGRLLERTLQDYDIDLFEDCLTMNTTRCFLKDADGKMKNASNYEIECCRKLALRTIEDYKPTVLILLGEAAILSIIGHRWKKGLGKITKWRGWTIPDQDFKCWICPTFDPKYVHTSKKQEITTVWEQDLERAVGMIDVPFREHVEPHIEVLSELNVLDTVIYPSAFDYETTGLKPHKKGHRIVCCSIAINENYVYVFMMPETRKERLPFIRYIRNADAKKRAQNMKYEHSWTSVILGEEVQGWEFDTMLASHILDNRTGVAGLKFQTYVQFGIVDYDSEIAPYLHGKDGDANSFNKVLELIKTPSGKAKLLKYCAYDSIYEYRLSKLQRNIIYNEN